MLKMTEIYQCNGGLTVLDALDEIEHFTNSFTGLSDLMLQFAQQISGSVDIPLVKLLGQSPAGLNSTGLSDLENYYSGIAQQQNSKLRSGIHKLLQIIYRSKFGQAPPGALNFTFRPLWSMSDQDKANVANTVTAAIVAAESNGIIDAATAAKELRASSHVTGVFSGISDEWIKRLEQQAKELEPPQPDMTGDPEENASAETK